MPRVASTRTVPTRDSLVDGVPPYMMGSALDFIKRFTTEHRGRDRRTGDLIIGVATDRIRAVERYLQIQLPDDPDDEFELQIGLTNYARDETHCLDVIEAMLATCYPPNLSQMMQVINPILLESGSKWIAVDNDGTAVLEERVDATTTEAFNTAVAASNDSSDLLKKAWRYAFGRNPSPSEAYNYAIKAMEAASWPIITPNNNSATLGHILGEMKTHPEKWHTKISEKQTNLGSETVASAMQLIWEGHTDRHGTANPVAVTQEAAEQAVFTTVMICDYFNRGYVTT